MKRETGDSSCRKLSASQKAVTVAKNVVGDRGEVESLATQYGTVFVFDPRGVGAVRNLGPSFVEMVTESDVPFYPQLTVFDVVGVCDIPHVVAALDEQGVPVETE